MDSTSRWQADLCGSLVSQIASPTHSSFGLCHREDCAIKKEKGKKRNEKGACAQLGGRKAHIFLPLIRSLKTKKRSSAGIKKEGPPLDTQWSGRQLSKKV